MLARDFWTDAAKVDRAIATRRAAVDERGRRESEQALRAVLMPPAARLLQLFTGLDDGVKFLVDLRADELRLAADPAIAHRRRRRARRPRRASSRRSSRRCSTSACSSCAASRGIAPAALLGEADRVRSGARDRLVGPT